MVLLPSTGVDVELLFIVLDLNLAVAVMKSVVKKKGLCNTDIALRLTYTEC